MDINGSTANANADQHSDEGSAPATPPTPEVDCNLPDRPPVTTPERRLISAYFGTIIARILSEGP